MIAPGAILIRNDTRLPETLMSGTRPFSAHWSLLASDSGGHLFEERLATSGWTSFQMASSIRRAAAGLDGQKMIEAALERVLAGARLQSCNFLEVDEIRMHSFLTIRYASVSGRAHQLAAGATSASGQASGTGSGKDL